MSVLRTEFVASFDGTRLAVHRLGAGPPVVLLHGLYSSADMNWIRFGHAAKVAAAGFEVIMPDFRAHGQSAAPRDPAAYPPGVLVRDVLALVEALELGQFDLGGFSLGARTAVGAVAAGLDPRRLALGGMGLESLGNWRSRLDFFVDAIDRGEEIERGDPAFYTMQFMRTMKVDPVAARLLLTLGVDDPPEFAIEALTMPTLVVAGDQDTDNGSPSALAAVLPDAEFVEIPGTHMGSVTGPGLGAALARFFAA